MTDGAYRGDLEAAQARIAQLEEQLREAEPTASPGLVEAQARHAAAIAASQRGGWRVLVGAAARQQQRR